MIEIQCPNCQTQYGLNVDNQDIISKRFRCAKCKHVFSLDANISKDTLPSEEDKPSQKEPVPQEVEVNKDVDEMFQRLDKSLKNYEENQEAQDDKSFSEMLGWTTAQNKAFYLLSFLVVVLLSLNYYRYEITRAFPKAEGIYSAIGIKSVVKGSGLEFVNVTKYDYINDGINYLGIKGYISNETDSAIKIPPIVASLLNKDAYELQKQVHTIKEEYVFAEDKVAFDISIKKPSPLGLYVYLTFEE